ncbi:hypothetical protein ARMGADRAFT_936695 [Armillaria gallica]|uniref:Large ribosomal subunit protein bL33m n=3 Tax=Armillaria TaxID=47424 RepID=A0A2H3DDD1_ARMGA|nr:hypothetical protein ARMGADRAFT_936695 [Armillaria gallica]
MSRLRHFRSGHNTCCDIAPSWQKQKRSAYRFPLLPHLNLTRRGRSLVVRLISTAQTGFFYTTKRLRQGALLSAVKYDPMVKRRVLFVESKKTKK